MSALLNGVTSFMAYCVQINVPVNFTPQVYNDYVTVGAMAGQHHAHLSDLAPGRRRARPAGVCAGAGSRHAGHDLPGPGRSGPGFAQAASTEPSAWALMLAGLVATTALARRRTASAR